VTVTDKYEITQRTITLKWHKTVQDIGVTAGQEQSFAFPNLIGRLPVVHWACDRGTNEQRGRPIYESLLPLFSRYDDLIVAAMDGAEIMGHPLPAFVGLENVAETIKANETAETGSYTDREGNTQERVEVRFDRDATVWVGKGGDFKFVAPPNGWSGDLRDILKSLFYLVLDSTRNPSFVGRAIASSRASAEYSCRRLYSMWNAAPACRGQGADDLLGHRPGRAARTGGRVAAHARACRPGVVVARWLPSGRKWRQTTRRCNSKRCNGCTSWDCSRRDGVETRTLLTTRRVS
jgi:hypothetical protein